MAFLDYSAKRMGPARLTRARGLYARRGKRIFDLVICFALLPVVAPAILVLWLLAMMTGPTGFFAHARVGKNGKAFRCWKIRTMIADADDALIKLFHRRPEAEAEWSKIQKLADDPRIMPLGRALRRSSLDELPQIWNVIKGDMSLVGPRPVTRVELRHYGEDLQHYLSIPPGVTGLWQITDRQSGCYVRRVALDKQYVQTISFVGDLAILGKTLPALFRLTGR